MILYVTLWLVHCTSIRFRILSWVAYLCCEKIFYKYLYSCYFVLLNSSGWSCARCFWHHRLITVPIRKHLIKLFVQRDFISQGLTKNTAYILYNSSIRLICFECHLICLIVHKRSPTKLVITYAWLKLVICGISMMMLKSLRLRSTITGALGSSHQMPLVEWVKEKALKFYTLHAPPE